MAGLPAAVLLRGRRPEPAARASVFLVGATVSVAGMAIIAFAPRP